MNRGWLIIVALLIAIGGAVFVAKQGALTHGMKESPSSSSRDTATPTEPGAFRPEPPDSTLSPTSRTTPTPSPAPTNLAEAEEAFAAAQTQHAEAVAALETAENELEDLEREIDAVERYIDDLLERGEHPARHAEEGMKLLNPVIERYETRLDRVEAADARVADATARLEQARANLAAFEQ